MFPIRCHMSDGVFSTKLGIKALDVSKCMNLLNSYLEQNSLEKNDFPYFTVKRSFTLKTESWILKKPVKHRHPAYGGENRGALKLYIHNVTEISDPLFTTWENADIKITVSWLPAQKYDETLKISFCCFFHQNKIYIGTLNTKTICLAQKLCTAEKATFKIQYLSVCLIWICCDRPFPRTKLILC